jgi:hypothetical protein
MAIKRTYVYRDGRIIEVTPGAVKKRNNVQTTGDAHDNMHACHVMDDLRQQHMIDSNRAEYAYNKKKRGA